MKIIVIMSCKAEYAAMSRTLGGCGSRPEGGRWLAVTGSAAGPRNASQGKDGRKEAMLHRVCAPEKILYICSHDNM